MLVNHYICYLSVAVFAALVIFTFSHLGKAGKLQLILFYVLVIVVIRQFTIKLAYIMLQYHFSIKLDVRY